jgi:exopolyphosphatase/pppGpp-phosphohydrolase
LPLRARAIESILDRGVFGHVAFAARPLAIAAGEGVLDAEQLAAAIEELSQLKRAKISKRYGIPAQRAATMLAGTLIFTEAQRRLGRPLELAGGGVREGAALALFRESAAAYA